MLVSKRNQSSCLRNRFCICVCTFQLFVLLLILQIGTIDGASEQVVTDGGTDIDFEITSTHCSTELEKYKDCVQFVDCNHCQKENIELLAVAQSQPQSSVHDRFQQQQQNGVTGTTTSTECTMKENTLCPYMECCPRCASVFKRYIRCEDKAIHKMLLNDDYLACAYDCNGYQQGVRSDDDNNNMDQQQPLSPLLTTTSSSNVPISTQTTAVTYLFCSIGMMMLVMGYSL